MCQVSARCVLLEFSFDTLDSLLRFSFTSTPSIETLLEAEALLDEASAFGIRGLVTFFVVFVVFGVCESAIIQR